MIDDYENINDKISERKKMKNALDNLIAKSLMKLQTVIDFINIANNISGFTISIPRKTIDEIKKCIPLVKRHIINQNTETNKFNELDKLVEKLSLQLQNDWNVFYSNRAQDLLQSLRVIKPLLPDPETAEIVEKAVSDFGSKWTMSANDLQNFLMAVQRGEQLIGLMTFTDEDIGKFLMLISSGNATINDLTDKVMEWIENNKLKHRIAITFKNNV